MLLLTFAFECNLEVERRIMGPRYYIIRFVSIRIILHEEPTAIRSGNKLSSFSANYRVVVLQNVQRVFNGTIMEYITITYKRFPQNLNITRWLRLVDVVLLVLQSHLSMSLTYLSNNAMKLSCTVNIVSNV